MKRVFENKCQLQVSWDSSVYDVETLICIVYSLEDDLACFLPVQNVLPVLSDELLPEIQELAALGKCTRVEHYNSL